MSNTFPLVSVVMATYNRAHTIKRAIDSVLNQTYTNFELIIIDDGSTDNTSEVLNEYKEPKIRIYKHEVNKGVAAAKNSGLREIKGAWFTILDSDDEMVPHAIATMINIPLSVDEAVTAVTCNCFDTTTKTFSGKGLNESQYIDVKTLMTVCDGEFWGITKSSLLQGDLLNEKLGIESILWYKVDDRANRYYIHEALRIYHTEGTDRISKWKYNFKAEVKFYQNLAEENFFLETFRKYRPAQYKNFCRKGLIVMRASSNKQIALKYYELSRLQAKSTVNTLIYKFKVASLLFKQLLIFKNWLKHFVSLFMRK